MNKKLIASVVASFVLSTGNAFAGSNPFVDVPANHWSYDSIQYLAKTGVIDGYSDGTFGGDKTITRYEMAQIVVKAMCKASKADDKQKDAISKLAMEYKEELDSIGVRLDNVEKKTAGVNDIKVTGWFSSENTVGNQFQAADPGKSLTETKNHEYALHGRLAFEKQLDEQLGAYIQFRTLSWLDKVKTGSAGSDNSVGTRLAYLTYKASPVTTFTVGKHEHWMADGLLMDDFIQGVTVNTKVGDKTNLMVMTGRYIGNEDNVRLSGGSVTTTVGSVGVGAHYLMGNKTFCTIDGNPITGYKETKIVAGTANYTFPSGLDLSFGYAKNTAAEIDNTISKVQLSKKIGGTDVTAQYWQQGQRMDWVAENGNYMAWWADKHHNGNLKGYRLILARQIRPNTLLEVTHGKYENTDTKVKARKDTVTVTVSF